MQFLSLLSSTEGPRRQTKPVDNRAAVPSRAPLLIIITVELFITSFQDLSISARPDSLARPYCANLLNNYNSFLKG